MPRWLFVVMATFLGLAAVWLVRADLTSRRGVELVPAEITLHVGERREIRLVSQEARVVACSFRLRFDERTVAVDEAKPEHASILEGGPAVHLPIRRGPGVVEVTGTALTGDRVFEPSAPIYRFTIRGLAPGTTVLSAEDFIIVDVDEGQRNVVVSPSRVHVTPP